MAVLEDMEVTEDLEVSVASAMVDWEVQVSVAWDMEADWEASVVAMDSLVTITIFFQLIHSYD